MHQLLRRYHGAPFDRARYLLPNDHDRLLFEGIESERVIAWRCEDSISLKAFLGYGLAERTPDHGALSVIRRRLGSEVCEAVFRIILQVLREADLLKGKKIAIDSSLIDANASMRSIVRRDTGESYTHYVGRLAKEAGMPADTREEQARFGKKRRKFTANED